MPKEALEAAKDHLDFCGYGDSYERECAFADKLPEKIEAAISVAELHEQAVELLERVGYFSDEIVNAGPAGVILGNECKEFFPKLYALTKRTFDVSKLLRHEGD